MKLAKQRFLQYKFKTFYIFVFCFLIGFLKLFSQEKATEKTVISGSIKLDSIWAPKIYLSNISSFDKMQTMSKRMIVAETDIDSSGNFKFDIDFLPIETQLYRIHVSKKNTSAASLIIGGKDENHFFIVANNKSNIQLKNTSTIFNNFKIINSKPNQIIRTIDSIVKEIDLTNFKESGIKNEFITKALNEKLKQIADTTSFPLVSLYALNKSKFETDVATNEQFYLDYLNKWKAEKSNYFKAFREKIKIKQKSEWPKFIILGLICFGLGFSVNYVFNVKKVKSDKKLKLLSIQERKIFTLLKEGKSNKEISEHFNISISTTKSHVSSIYSKLNINSRKEIIDT